MANLSHHVAKKHTDKDRLEQEWTQVHHLAKNKSLQQGHTRDYRSYAVTEGAEPNPADSRPAERAQVQVKCLDLLRLTEEVLSPLMDNELTVDSGNQLATGNIVVDGNTLASGVPVTTLLWLENRLANLATLVKSMPLVDAAQVWSWDSDKWRSEPVTTQSTQRVWKALVKHEGTDRHPPQTESYQMDEPVGEWTRVNLSGSMKPNEVRRLVQKIAKLQNAVEVARHEATSMVVESRHMASDIFGYLLSDIDQH